MTPRQYILRTAFWATLIGIVLVGVWLWYRIYFAVDDRPPVTAADAAVAHTHYEKEKQGMKIALTFDDGPHATYTDQIMDILEKSGTPATFFVIGKNVLENPGIARAINERGFGLGAHSFLHEHEDYVSREHLAWELDAGDRAISAVTGVSPRFYRAPYLMEFGHTVVFDPTKPAAPSVAWALELGYLPVGADIDSFDWSLEDKNDILLQIKQHVGAGRVMVLHDTKHTAEALPSILAYLRYDGYTVVPLEELIGLPGGSVVAAPIGAFGSVAPFMDRIGIWAFAFTVFFFKSIVALAVILITIRLLVVVALLIWSYIYKNTAPPIVNRSVVSVIIPAWNEEENIEATMRSVLQSYGVNKEVIVVDDGSTDRTYEIASTIAKGESHTRVTVIKKPNGGKASALNMGIARARGSVIVCLDADTIFTPDTVAYLVAPLKDPKVGAVSGKVCVANRSSLLASMQHLEYLIGQNVHKRSFAMVNALSVIPGAVGAWRKRDILLVGGVPTDTLVEDHALTLAILTLGRSIVYEPRAIAYTEAPATVAGFVKQRTRWVYGAFECALKYRHCLFSRTCPNGLRFALFNAYLYDLFLPFFYPLVDGIILVALLTGSFSTIALPLLMFIILDFATVIVATLGEKDKRYTLITVLLMRVVYRQLLFYTFIKSFVRLVEKRSAGWQKVARNGDAHKLFFGLETVTVLDNAMSGHLPPILAAVLRGERAKGT